MSDKEETPPSRRLPFDASGRLLPNGPEFPTSHEAPDIKGLPWDRRPNREWTQPEHRALVLEVIRKWMHKYSDGLSTWKVIERDCTERSTLRLLDPRLVFQFTMKNGEAVEIGVSFPKYVRDETLQFQLRLDDTEGALRALLQQHGYRY